MAAEKVSNLIFVIEQTLEFLNEYKIEPEKDVKEALLPKLFDLNEWLKKVK